MNNNKKHIRTGNRGMLLESVINKTIIFYKENNVGIFHKKELPITFSKIDEHKGKFSLVDGIIKNKSTADYYGCHNGSFYAFEAKSTKLNSLPLSNIKEHQTKYLLDIQAHGGISFFIIYFNKFNEFYKIYPDSIEKLKRKSISLEFAKEHGILLELTYPGILDFLE